LLHGVHRFMGDQLTTRIGDLNARWQVVGRD